MGGALTLRKGRLKISKAFSDDFEEKIKERIMANKKSTKDVPAQSYGKAPAHGELANNKVHIFVDDQNLFYGITNQIGNRGYRIDFGRLLTYAAKDFLNKDRFVKTAFIAGVIPDDYTFLQKAQKEGFKVKRGYLANGTSKCDDSYLVAEIMETIYEEESPSTIVLIAGDADYIPPLEKALKKGWRVEVFFIDKGKASNLENYVHLFRTLNHSAIQYIPQK